MPEVEFLFPNGSINESFISVFFSEYSEKNNSEKLSLYINQGSKKFLEL